MKAQPTFLRMLADNAAHLAFIVAVGLCAVGLVTWWNATRVPASTTAAFLSSLTNPPPPLIRAPDFSAQEAALSAGSVPVRVSISGAHNLFIPDRPPVVASGGSR